jgi:polysaccharide export outer membrane protein
MHGGVVTRDQVSDFIVSRNARVSAAFRYFSLVAIWAVLLVLAVQSAEAVQSNAYRLAPGDRITVTVFGQPELSGDLLIDDVGTITLPLTDPIEVKDLTLLECQKRIADRLANGILQTPSVSVRVAELRPLYVLGDVRLPGSYPFRYGSTVRSAVALAGGFGPGELLRNTAVSEFLVAEERVHQLNLQQRTMLVRRVRLEAQLDGQETFSPPAFDAAEDKDTREIVANERDIFSAQAAILRGEIESLRAQKPHLKEQIEANTEQGNAGKKQLEMIRQQIGRYENIYRQGLGTQNNDFQYRILEANQESTVWRLLSEVARLHFLSGDLDFKIQEVEAAFKRQIALQLHDTRDRLKELEVTLPAAIRVRDIKFQYAGGAAAQGAKHLISITRTRNGNAVVLNADETTSVDPGDVIDIKIEMQRVLSYGGATGGLTASRSDKSEQSRGGETVGTISR